MSETLHNPTYVCLACDGSGEQVAEHIDGWPRYEACDRCGGTGHAPETDKVPAIYLSDAGDECSHVELRALSPLGGLNACCEVFEDGTERLVSCDHPGHATYTRLLAHVGRPIDIPVPLFLLEEFAS